MDLNQLGMRIARDDKRSARVSLPSGRYLAVYLTEKFLNRIFHVLGRISDATGDNMVAKLEGSGPLSFLPPRLVVCPYGKTACR